jgi:ABC-type nitrate/sulfonate/bicarbonate transport system substrate-binding protein
MAGYGVAGLAATRLLAACGSDSSGTSANGVTTFSVQLSWVKDVEYGQLYLADSNKHYSEQKVALDMTPGGSDIGAIEGIVAGGSADIGISTDITTVVAAVADGNPLVAIGSLYQSNLNVFMSPPDKPITSVQQLQGLRIGGAQGTQVKYDAMFKIAGLDPDYTFVPTGYGPDSLINGDCDVQSGFITDEVLAYGRQTGSPPSIFTFTDAGLPSYTLPMYVTQDTLDAKRDALKGFLRATLQGCAEDLADPAAAAKLAAEKYGTDADLTTAEETEKNQAYLPLMSSSFTDQHGYLWIDPDYLSGPIYKGMEAAGLKTTDVSKVVDMSLLQEIAAEG